MFPCDRCGICCRLIKNLPFTKHMQSEDGICKYLDRDTNLCSIYNDRPLLCNVDAGYDALYQNKMTREEFYQKNQEACEKLKEEYAKCQMK